MFFVCTNLDTFKNVLSIYLSVSLSICQSIYLSVCLSIYLSVCLDGWRVNEA